MTDAEYFYLLLALFYLIECLSIAPSGSRAFVSRDIHGHRWKPSRTGIPINGLRKVLFLCPILPWPRMLIRPKTEHSPLSTHSLRHLRKKVKLLNDTTHDMRIFGLFLFIHFFIFLPVVNFFYAGTVLIVITVIYGYFVCAFVALRFFAIHRRYFPKLKGERFKNTLYCLFLPWHAMRAADIIIIRRSATWHPLAILGNDPTYPPNKKILRRAWNEASYYPKAKTTHEELTHLFNQNGQDITTFMAPPKVPDDEAYCPVCETTYLASTTHCATCKGIRLKRNSDN